MEERLGGISSISLSCSSMFASFNPNSSTRKGRAYGNKSVITLEKHVTLVADADCAHHIVIMEY